MAADDDYRVRITMGVGQNSWMVGASRCDARTPQRGVPTSETKNFVSAAPVEILDQA